MRTNTSEAEKQAENEKKGTQRVHSEPVSRIAKDQIAYWKPRVRPRVLASGKTTAELYLRLKENGRTAWLPLNSSNRAKAAEAARDLWLDIRARGLGTVLAERNRAPKPAHVCTVGELIAAARIAAEKVALKKKRPPRARTLDFYAANLRRIAAAVAGIEGDAARFGPNGEEWRKRVDAVSLGALTEDAVAKWQSAYIAQGEGHAAQESRAASARTIIRNARALLSKAMLPALAELVTLPSPVPFAGISTKPDTRRHKPTVRASVLHAAAWKELSHDGDALAAFLLLLVAGLRRGEADYLEWGNVHLDGTGSALDGEGPRVDVATTHWWRPKTEESKRSVPLPADVVTFLRGLRAANPDAVFVLRGRAPRMDAALGEYRAYVWERLSEWLRKHGVTARCPLHELRKMSGAFVTAVAGLEAARRHLGHRSVTTTANSYTAADAVTVALPAPEAAP